MIYLDQIMRFRLKILISALILFFSFEILEIKAHNTSNEACKDFCFNLINKKGNEKKIKIYKNNKKLFREQNSCVNNSLCRG